MKELLTLEENEILVAKVGTTMGDIEIELFPTNFNEILQRVDGINPLKYGTSRNFIDGAVTYLSPYISRGVISTKYILNRLLSNGYDLSKIEKFIQELTWRDYWQKIWVDKGTSINSDLKNTQEMVSNYGIPNSVVKGSTGIKAIDQAISEFYKTGYIHNHLRMYIASIACNIAQSHWKQPAQWMYYYLLDADWASNALSWQWVAGSNSNKKYYANQENINKYCYTHQKVTFLDIQYEEFQNLKIPESLQEIAEINLSTCLPSKGPIIINQSLPTLIYNFYNLDPLWHKDKRANRILLLEPSHFKKYPISQNSMDFMLQLAENIDTKQVYVGEFKDFINEFKVKNIYYKEHPLNKHYLGEEESRDWMFNVKEHDSSFFSYWKKCKLELTY